MNRLRTYLILSLLILTGCKTNTIVKHPDAPMLVTESSGKVRVSVYDAESKSLVDFGWVEVPQGWTISKYDWERYINGHR